MRKTLIAMLGLVALGLWAMPALAARSNKDPLKDPPKVSEPIPLENQAGIWQKRAGGDYQGTLSGTLIKQSQATTTWFLYPGACADRVRGTWSPKTSPQSDSLATLLSGSVTDESVTLTGTTLSNLTKYGLQTISVTDLAGTTLFCEGHDYTVDRQFGRLARVAPSSGTITDEGIVLSGTTPTALAKAHIISLAITSSTTAGSTTVTSAGLFGAVTVGMEVTGIGIPAGTTVIAKASTSSITISTAATVTTTTTLTFSFKLSITSSTTVSSTTVTSAGLFGAVTKGMGVIGPGITPGTIVTAKASASSITISTAATVTTTTTLRFCFSVYVTDVAASVTYTLGTDFTFDADCASVTRIGSGAIANGQTVKVSYLFSEGMTDGATVHASYSFAEYGNGTTGPYDIVDLSLSEIQWHVTDGSDPATEPAPINAGAGANMLWCGKFDANWAVKVGYPNLTYQILYIDTNPTGAARGATYVLTFKHNFSAELNYDFVYFIGNHDFAKDPLGNLRSQLDLITAAGGQLITYTGSIITGTTAAAVGQTITGLGAGQPVTATSNLTIDSSNRALYIVFKSDCLFSSEDGLWPEGHGQMMDDVSASDTGAIYTNEAGTGFVDSFFGNVIKGTALAPIISARVAPGIGKNWHLEAGNLLPTPDICTPKNTTSDQMFVAGNFAHQTIANENESIVLCSFPIPPGTASVLALWNMYLDLPRFQGFVQQSEFRIHKDGSWGLYNDTDPGGGVLTGAAQSWFFTGEELAAATQADSVQIRHSMLCIPFFSADHNNCGAVTYGIMYDDFRLEIVTGVPAPIFGVFVGSIAQSMFVDGTLSGDNCLAATVAAGDCWPGVRGSDLSGSAEALASAVHDNFNSPLGDSITLALATGLRKNGKGINWRLGFDKSVNGGRTIAHTNPNFVAAFGAPRVIYRIFDPTSKTWSPFDSSELDANAVSIQAGDTILIDSEYRVNWPPRDKVGTTFPVSWGSFTVNGTAAYNNLKFMPQGSRIQYYWKAVDINGGVTYQFSTDALAREVEELPTLPGGSIVAPDILEFDVLPRVYPAGAAGTLLDGQTTTPILDLDGSYTRWAFGSHATVQILRSLGVRADRYRTLQGLEEGGHVGGHEFAGTRAGRLSNYFPNMAEYGIKGILTNAYRIMIESSHTSTVSVDEESDSKLIREWWEAETGSNGGDRCIFASGDNYFNALLQVSGVPHPNENLLSTAVFGVAATANQWNGGGSNQFPLIKDRFADPAAGPGLGVSGAYSYIIDGGCPGPNRFDALTKIGSADAVVSATYPTVAAVTDAAAIAHSTELDVAPDNDRNKALGYGFSIQFIRQGGMNLIETRAQVLYKFLTSCRGPRTTETGVCWPCPSNASPIPSNWATSTVFQIQTYGPLYPIQDATLFLTAVGEPPAAPPANRLQGSFPNPFNPETAIRFTVAKPGRAEVRIFDVAGRLVQTLAKNVTQGVNEVRWNGKSSNGSTLASGVYFVKVKNADGTESENSLKIAIVR